MRGASERVEERMVRVREGESDGYGGFGELRANFNKGWLSAVTSPSRRERKGIYWIQQ